MAWKRSYRGARSARDRVAVANVPFEQAHASASMWMAHRLGIDSCSGGGGELDRSLVGHVSSRCCQDATAAHDAKQCREHSIEYGLRTRHHTNGGPAWVLQGSTTYHGEVGTAYDYFVARTGAYFAIVAEELELVSMTRCR